MGDLQLSANDSLKPSEEISSVSTLKDEKVRGITIVAPLYEGGSKKNLETLKKKVDHLTNLEFNFSLLVPLGLMLLFSTSVIMGLFNSLSWMIVATSSILLLVPSLLIGVHFDHKRSLVKNSKLLNQCNKEIKKLELRYTKSKRDPLKDSALQKIENSTIREIVAIDDFMSVEIVVNFLEKHIETTPIYLNSSAAKLIPKIIELIEANHQASNSTKKFVIDETFKLLNKGRTAEAEIPQRTVDRITKLAEDNLLNDTQHSFADQFKFKLYAFEQ